MNNKTIINKDKLLKTGVFKNSKYFLKFDKDNKFAFLIPGDTNFLRIYTKDGNIMAMINVDRDGKIGNNISTTNDIIGMYGFEIQI